MVREGDAFVTFYPEKAQRVTCGINHIGEAMIIGKQWMSWAPAEDEPYRWSLSPARSYYTHPQARSGWWSWHMCCCAALLQLLWLCCPLQQGFDRTPGWLQLCCMSAELQWSLSPAHDAAPPSGALLGVDPELQLHSNLLLNVPKSSSSQNLSSSTVLYTVQWLCCSLRAGALGL